MIKQKVLFTIILAISFSCIFAKLNVQNKIQGKVNDDIIYPGIKFSFDTSYATLLQNLDLSKVITGIDFLKGKSIEINEKYGIISINVSVKKLVVDSFKSPENVEVINKKITDTSASTNIILKKLQIKLKSDFDIKVSFASDSVKNSPIEIDIDQVDIEYYFNNGQISLNKLNVDISKIDISFESFLYKTVYWMIKDIIRKQINKSITQYKDSISAKINKLINDEDDIKVPVVDLYFNATDVQKPILFFKTIENSNKETKSVEQFINNNTISIKDDEKKFLFDSDNEHMYNFYSEIVKNILQLPQEHILTNAEFYSNKVNTELANTGVSFTPLNSQEKAFLEFGVSGYAYVDKAYIPIYPKAVDMQFKPDSYSKGVSILISDFTINSLLYIVQSSGKLFMKLDKYSKLVDQLPFKIDTKGLQQIIPELKDRYGDQAKEAVLKIFVPAINVIQPTIGTSYEMMHFKIHFNFELTVQESEDPFDDPIKVLISQNVIDLNFVVNIKNDLINIYIHDVTIKEVNVTEKVFDKFDTDRFAYQLNSLIGLALDSMVKPNLLDIDINKQLEKVLPVGLKLLPKNWDLEEGYNSFDFTVEKK